MWMFLPGIVLEFMGVLFIAAGILTRSTTVMIAGICLIGLAIGIHILQVMGWIGPRRAAGADERPSSLRPESPDGAALLYFDSLVTITGNAITFRNYSFPLGKARTVAFADIDHIDVLEPALSTGKYRIWGSGNLRTWFPLDSGRSSRDKMFHAYLNVRGMDIGFTVERSGEVISILRERGLIRPKGVAGN